MASRVPAIVALDAATGAPRWRIPFDATEFAVITSLAPLDGPGGPRGPGSRGSPGGFVVGGTFAGTLRVGDAHAASPDDATRPGDAAADTARPSARPSARPAARPSARDVVSSAGRSDGFVALLGIDGSVRWVVRLGGPGADAVQGVAARADRVAIAGTFTGGAELLGQPLAAFDERLPFADGFVGELDTAGALRWVQTFGGKDDDAVAGVAIDTQGRVVVAATVRDTIKLDGRDLDTRGDADGLVAWFTPGGEAGAAAILGGTEFDGLRAIAATDDRVVVGGFFHGTIVLGKRVVDSNGGDDSFFAELDARGQVESSWHVAGPGREEITALASVPGGFVAGVAHTGELSLEGTRLPAPADPGSGAVVLGRPAP